MAYSRDFVATLKYLHPNKIADAFQAKTNPKYKKTWNWKNEIRPVDLYCYFGVRFGPPNGMQSWLRANHSENLIHWEWAFACEFGWIFINGMNFRTQVHLLGDFPDNEDDESSFKEQLKADFANYGRQMSELRKSYLEHWIEFVNPFVRLKRSIDRLLQQLSLLTLNPDEDALKLDQAFNTRGQGEVWNNISERYSTGLGLCFGIRSMLPVMAESFVNLLLFFLMKPEIKLDDRLRENIIRQPIDIRVKSLHHNCQGFTKAVDYSDPACRRYHTLVNERNDLLHGNFSVSKLEFNEIFFDGTVPVFKEYRSLWERSFGVDVRAVGLRELEEELATVEAFVSYVRSCLDSKSQEYLDRIMESRDLGYNTTKGSLGLLFSGTLVDMVAGGPLPE